MDFVTGRMHGTVSFKNHEKSAIHAQAVQVVIHIPKTHVDIGEQLSREHAKQKLDHRHALYQIMKVSDFSVDRGLL